MAELLVANSSTGQQAQLEQNNLEIINDLRLIDTVTENMKSAMLCRTVSVQVEQRIQNFG